MRAGAANGWQFFVATLLLVIGAVNIIQGLVAFFSPDFYIGTSTDMLFLEYGSWGVLLGLWGAVLIIAGLAVLSGSTWARAFAIVLASLNALAQLTFVVAMPLWSMVVIAVDILVIYGLTAGWPSSQSTASTQREEDEAVYRSGYRASHATPQQAQSPEQTAGQRRSTTGQGP